MNKVSNSKLDLFETCGKKFQFRYIDNLKGDYTSSALLFGTALDSALNYILQSIKDDQLWFRQRAVEEFDAVLQTWNGENRLDFFKGDVPTHLQDQIDEMNPDFQEIVWDEMYKRGLNCIDVYIKEVLPLFDSIVSVQNKIEIPNQDGDTFVGVVDFIAKLKDGRTVLFDNKTASAKYPKNKVVKSQQLSLYLENFPEIRYAGYVVLIKNPEREKGLTHQILIDEIPEETRKDSFDRLEKALYDIKNKKFEMNLKSCHKFNKPCEYMHLCKYGNPEGLVPAYEKKIDKPDKE